MLEEDGLVVSGSRFIYAIGKLVLWSAEPEKVDGNDRLLDGDFRFLAIANPTLAPYGRAARQALAWQTESIFFRWLGSHPARIDRQ